LLRRAAAVWVVWAWFWGALAESASAQEGIFAGMQKGIELTSSSVSTKTTFASGLTTRTDTSGLFPAARLNMDTLLYPNLRLNAGGVFELNRLSTSINGSVTDSTISRNRPFVLLRSTNPVFSPGVGYFRREDRARTGAAAGVKLVNDEYAAYLGWNPGGGPRSDLQFIRTHTFDRARTLQDITREFGTLASTYEYRNLGGHYRGSYLGVTDRLQDLRTRQVIHAARVTDGGALIRKRLVWSATYNINHQDLRTDAGPGAGEVAIPVIPFGGLAATSDLPQTARLVSNAALVDGNLTASAGVNLGLALPPEDAQARNIGLDFVNPTRVNRLLVWIHREVPFEIASAFAWEIYSSSDNLVWRREALVSTARFGPFEHRFEIDFPVVTARYLKAVVRPLSAAVPEASRYADIFVTELQAFLRERAGEVSRQVVRTSHVANADVRMRILDAPSLFYEGFYFYTGPSTLGTSTSTLSNGLSVNQAFARIFSVYGRVAREQGTEPLGDRMATVANATLTVEPIPTFRSSLLYSGQDERVGGVPRSRSGVFLQNVAQVYRGVDLLFGAGWSDTTRETGEASHERLTNLSATIVPRPRVSLAFSIDDRRTDRAGVFTGPPRTRTRRLYAALSVDPIRTLHLVLGHERIAVTGQNARTTLEVLANWTPFPEGALQFVFAYNEALRPLEFGQDGSTLAVVRWNLSRRSYVDLTYQKTRSEFVFQTTESRVLGLSLRVFV
jgi:hypothetical protein